MCYKLLPVNSWLNYLKLIVNAQGNYLKQARIRPIVTISNQIITGQNPT